jgi:DNA-binding PadR family transcriptional regulator
MKLLTRIEELILFSIWRLQDNAYCIPIHEHIVKLTGENILLGSIYMPLDRLVKREYLESYLSDSTPERGGRHKRIYRVTPEGRKALHKVRELQHQMWEEAPHFSFEKE